MPYTKPGQTRAWCKLGEHEAPVDDFRGRWRETPHGTVWHIDPGCKLHQETQRHEVKHDDLPMHVLLSRADSLARRTGTTREFILHDPRGPCWIRLLPMLRAFLAAENCVSCGKPFEAETRDVQFDHIHPTRDMPNGEIDWARHCARNIRILDGSCNNSKGRRADEEWIDQQYRYQLLDADRTDGVLTARAEQDEIEARAEAEALAAKPCACPPGAMCLLCYRDEDELAA
jgi:hypothetical protein